MIFLVLAVVNMLQIVIIVIVIIIVVFVLLIVIVVGAAFYFWKESILGVSILFTLNLSRLMTRTLFTR